MFTVLIAFTILTIVVNTFSATVDFARYHRVLTNMARVGVPESWLTTLGVLKAAGAVGLALGLLGVPVIGEMAAAGLVLFFTGAIVTHLRAGDYALGFPGAYLVMAAATLSLDVAV